MGREPAAVVAQRGARQPGADDVDVQVAVRQHMPERRVLDRLRARGRRQAVRQGLAPFVQRQAEQARPDALVGPLLQPHPALLVLRVQQPQRDLPARHAPRLDRVALGCALARRHAVTDQRAHRAGRSPQRADAGAQVHQSLRVGGHAAGQVVLGQQAFGPRPQRALVAGFAQVVVDAEGARQHALDVAVQDGGALAEAERRDGRRRRAADARQRGQLGRRARKRAAKARHHLTRAAVQVARTRVIAQPAPQPQHLVLGRGGQAGDVGKALEKARVVAQHRRHLRLLQHDFRQPHAVRIARALPRQAVAAVLALPVDDAGGKRRAAARHAGTASACSDGVAWSALAVCSSRLRVASRRSMASRADSCSSISPMRRSSPPAASWMRWIASMRRP